MEKNRIIPKTLLAAMLVLTSLYSGSLLAAGNFDVLPNGEETEGQQVTMGKVSAMPTIVELGIQSATARENKIAECRATHACGLESDPLRTKCQNDVESCNIDCTGSNAFSITCRYSSSAAASVEKIDSVGDKPGKGKDSKSTNDNYAEVSRAVSECEDAEKDAGSSCDENQSDVSYWRNRLGQFSSQLSQMSQANPAMACSQMSDISAGISGSVGAWKAYCQNKINNCTNVCAKSAKTIKGIGDSSDAESIRSARAACVKLNNKTGSAEASLAEAQRTAQAAAKCRADVISQQQAAANPNYNNPFNQQPNIGQPGQRSFTPPELGGRAASEEGDERASGRSKSSTLLGGGPGATDGAPSAGAEEDGSRPRNRQNQALPAQSGMSGKISSNGNSLTAKGPQQRPNYFNNATALNANVFNGSYGMQAGGAANAKALADSPAAVALRPIPGKGVYVGGRWVPKGGSVLPQNKAVALRNKVNEEFRKGYRLDDGRSMAATTGPDGVTGPKSNLFFKVRSRYSIHFPNLDR